MKRSVWLLVVAALVTAGLSAPPVSASSPAYRPDAWIKLCGQSTGCTINPPPHPWRGKNIYNTTARHQTIHQRIDNGEGVRYWIMFQNDGTQKDTFDLNGCKGTKRFVVNSVLIGMYKVPQGTPNWIHITDAFINDTQTFTLAPGHKVAITLNIVTKGMKNVSYRCPVSITSEGDTTLKDTVAATMTIF